ncbi:hypothetical protein KZO37_13280 [Rhodococcus fascians]|uniref:hypothetical protein n=1 Tax=Nocardiaceae TaxID=85025 RepID=UPI0019D2AA1B|nr:MULTISPECIES: hypothetical protein [Rhodococcus]MBW4780338.1 hypothetical protein [Rhodococcus fascians]MDJ0005007.1 hypothetical protein [Rhodococcus fascians]
MSEQHDGIEVRGMSKYLKDRPNALQMMQGKQREANAERETPAPAPVTEIASERGKALTRIARDTEARRAHYAAEKAERDRLEAARERSRVQRAKDALEHRTEIVDPTARGMARYAGADSLS